MRSVKTKGILTRGRGLTETQRLVWLLSMPACAEVNYALQDLTAVKYINPSLLTPGGICLETIPKIHPTVEKCSMFSMDDHLCIGLHGIEVLPTVAYAHNTSRMCEDGTVMPLLHSMAMKLEHQQRT